jgi:hypothetical protein
MKPFTTALFHCVSLFHKSQERMHSLSSAGRTEVLMWRSFLLLLHLDEMAYARTFASFRPRPPSILIEYDASLTGLAVAISTLHPDRSATMVACTRITPPFAPTTDSSKQNLYEFLAVVMGLLLAKHLGLEHFAFDLAGDSTSSLSWAHSDRVASALAQRAGLAFTSIATAVDASVAEIKFLFSEQNRYMDAMSRGLSAVEAGLPAGLEVTLSHEHPIVQFIELCDPDAPLIGSDAVLSLLSALRTCLARIAPPSSDVIIYPLHEHH